MGRKNFWHWLGLPCLADIQELTASALRQEEILASLKILTEETRKSFDRVQSELTASVDQIGTANHEVIESSTREVCNILLRYNDEIRKLVIERTAKLYEGIETLEVIGKEICSLDRDTQEKIEKTLTECRNQNELLRILIANTLIEDASNLMNGEQI